ncbi:hypothetical protein J6590_078817 [Homalodisca vitripennis]|nr:hypothetical protein J6590_078817 [Homalodisca vitripennis]
MYAVVMRLGFRVPTAASWIRTVGLCTTCNGITLKRHPQVRCRLDCILLHSYFAARYLIIYIWSFGLCTTYNGITLKRHPLVRCRLDCILLHSYFAARYLIIYIWSFGLCTTYNGITLKRHPLVRCRLDCILLHSYFAARYLIIYIWSFGLCTTYNGITLKRHPLVRCRLDCILLHSYFAARRTRSLNAPSPIQQFGPCCTRIRTLCKFVCVVFSHVFVFQENPLPQYPQSHTAVRRTRSLNAPSPIQQFGPCCTRIRTLCKFVCVVFSHVFVFQENPLPQYPQSHTAVRSLLYPD